MSTELDRLIARAGEDIPVGAPPRDRIVAESARITRRRVAASVGLVTAVVLAIPVAALVARDTASRGTDDNVLSPLRSPNELPEDRNDGASEERYPLPSVTEGWNGEDAPVGTVAVVADTGEQGYVRFDDLAASEYYCAANSRPDDCQGEVRRLSLGGYLDETGALGVPVYAADGLTTVGRLTRGVLFQPGEPLRGLGNDAGYPVNERGQTYGPVKPGRSPDLERTVGDHGVLGYTLTAEQSPSTPEQALEWQSRWQTLGHGPIRNVYAEDGYTVIDVFTLSLGVGSTFGQP